MKSYHWQLQRWVSHQHSYLWIGLSFWFRFSHRRHSMLNQPVAVLSWSLSPTLDLFLHLQWNNRVHNIHFYSVPRRLGAVNTGNFDLIRIFIVAEIAIRRRAIFFVAFRILKAKRNDNQKFVSNIGGNFPAEKLSNCECDVICRKNSLTIANYDEITLKLQPRRNYQKLKR